MLLSPPGYRSSFDSTALSQDRFRAPKVHIRGLTGACDWMDIAIFGENSDLDGAG
jgi:hypothetical protein